jgi:glycosyltransferase involved in cell wall biosynthesis
MKPNAICVTQAFNAEKLVGRAIESVLSQTRGDLQHFVLDNGSSDHTFQVILDYAMQDSRVIPLHAHTNDIRNGGMLFQTITYSTGVKWLFWLDADDEYTPDFYEKASRFGDEEKLDYVMTGYDMIDGKTNELLKHRVCDSTIVLTHENLVPEFMNYRAFIMCTWGKLYRTAFLKKRGDLFRLKKLGGLPRLKKVGDLSRLKASKANLIKLRAYSSFDDSVHQMKQLLCADRIGLLNEAMYKYYQYSNSAIHDLHKDNLQGFFNYCFAVRDFLDAIGSDTEQNEDFYHAICMSIVQDMLKKVMGGISSGSVKPDCLLEILDHFLVHKVFARKADPMFHILAERGEYLTELMRQIEEIEFSNDMLLVRSNIFHAISALRSYIS